MEIIIRGEQGEGKTLLGVALTGLLKKHGLNATYEYPMPCTEKTLENLKKQLTHKKITIRTEQKND